MHILAAINLGALTGLKKTGPRGTCARATAACRLSCFSCCVASVFTCAADSCDDISRCPPGARAAELKFRERSLKGRALYYPWSRLALHWSRDGSGSGADDGEGDVVVVEGAPGRQSDGPGQRGRFHSQKD